MVKIVPTIQEPPCRMSQLLLTEYGRYKFRLQREN
jgi:hypothetical protein